MRPRAFVIPLLATRGRRFRRVETAEHVRRTPVARVLAGLRESCRSVRVRQLEGTNAANRSPIPPRGVRHVWRGGTIVPVGRGAADIGARKFRFRALGPHAGRFLSEWRQRIRRFRPFRERLGVDIDRIRTAARLRALSLLPGYSADFFDGKHYVMKGGSTRTAASMLRRSFRNWFQPHYPNIYSSLRLVSA